MEVTEEWCRVWQDREGMNMALWKW